MRPPALVPFVLLVVTVALFWAYAGEGAAFLAFWTHLVGWSLARHWGGGAARISSPSPSAPPRAGAD